MMRRLVIIAAVLLSPVTARAWVIQHNIATVSGSTSCGSVLISSDPFTRASTGNELLTVDGMWAERTTLNGYSVYVDRTNDVALSTTNTGGGAYAALSATLTCHDYSVEWSGKTGNTTASQRSGVLARYDPATHSGFLFRIEGDGDADLYRVDAGVNTLLGHTTVAAVLGAFSATTNYLVEMHVKGTSITCYLDNTQALFVIDATYATGNPGVFLTNTGARGDSFSATYLP